MMKISLAASSILILAALVSSCTVDVDVDDAESIGEAAAESDRCVPTPEVCTDGIDNDCDGNIDCADRDCGAHSACAPPCVPTAESCTDGIDNDCDGHIDCADSNCSAHSACNPG